MWKRKAASVLQGDTNNKTRAQRGFYYLRRDRDSKYSTFGVIKIDKDKVHLYSSRDKYHMLTIGKLITNAVWAGNFLNVSSADGKVRRYSSRDSYRTV